MHPAEKYIEDVLSGKQPACRFVRLAVERHVRDLKDGHKRGLRFEPEAAKHKIAFYKFLRHSKGEWAGQIFNPEPWQQFIDWVIFGWIRRDGTRRFREAYLELPRKNGKSTKGAGDGNYLFAGDGEPGAEVYTAATKREQAKIIHEEAKRMVRKSPALRQSVRVLRDNLHDLSTASKFEPLGADADTLDGLNLHGAIVDELHAHKTRALCDVLDTATGSRRQPLIEYITTAGDSINCVCWEKRDYTRKVLTGQVEDDDFFGIIFTLDVKTDWPELLTEEEAKKPGAKGIQEDSWDDESVWIKANPNLNVSVKIDDLRRKARKAKVEPDALVSFLRYHLDLWVSSAMRWIPMPVWDSNGGDLDSEKLKKVPGAAGLDLSTTTDLCSLVCAFLVDGEPRIMPFFWIPEDSLRKKAKHEADMLRAWVKKGLIRATPGGVVDYDDIERKVEELKAEGYVISGIGFDPWNATATVQHLEKKGFKMVPYRQGWATMSPACKQFMNLLLQGKLHHGGHPVLRWNADNVVVHKDSAGNIVPDKSKSYNRIDGAVAAIIAVDLALRGVSGTGGPSVYEKRGIRVLA